MGRSKQATNLLGCSPTIFPDGNQLIALKSIPFPATWDTPAQAYPDLLRNANASDSLPYNVFQNPAYALGLLSRNLDDPILVDLYVYERNLLLELALEPLFPRHGYIPGSAIRRILNETY